MHRLRYRCGTAHNISACCLDFVVGVQSSVCCIRVSIQEAAPNPAAHAKLQGAKLLRPYLGSPEMVMNQGGELEKASKMRAPLFCAATMTPACLLSYMPILHSPCHPMLTMQVSAELAVEQRYVFELISSTIYAQNVHLLNSKGAALFALFSFVACVSQSAAVLHSLTR